MNIHEWILANPGSDDDRAVQQAAFIRDRVGKALFPKSYPREAPIEVVGEHRSKSAVLPVCLARFERPSGGGLVTVRFRNNWYNWAIFDESDAHYLNSLTMDGFVKGQVFGPYSASRWCFSCLIWGPDEVFWMFCRLLRGK